MTQARTLADVGPGAWVTLGPPLLEPRHNRRLAELGLRAGAVVLVSMRSPCGGRVLAVDDSRIALDRPTLRRMPVVGNDRDQP